MAGNSDLIDIKMKVHAETKKAILVSDDEDRDKAIWLPLSQIEIERLQKGFIMVTLPEWLAIEKGLV